MKKILPLLLLLSPLVMADDKSPDESFYRKAAEGNVAEVQQGQLAQQLSETTAVKEFGAMMVTDHSVANEKLRAVAATKGIELPTIPNAMQIESKTKLQVLVGDAFDKAYIKGMVSDHQQDINEFEMEAQSGRDPDARAFAVATLLTLRMHLQKIQAIAAKEGVKLN